MAWAFFSFLPGWQEPRYLGHPLLPPRVHISKKLALETELGLEPKHPGLGHGCPKRN